MQPITVRVFVSSTWLDLRPERSAVEELLQRFRETKFVGMEYFGGRDETTRRASLEEVDRSDLFICIIGGRYGSGITEAEHERAHGDVSCLIYFKAENAIPPEGRDTESDKRARLGAFKRALKDPEKGHTVPFFSGPYELASMLASDLHHWLFDRYLSSALRDAAEGKLAPETSAALNSDLRDLAVIDRDLVTQVAAERQRLDEQRRVALEAFYELTYTVPEALAGVPDKAALREELVRKNLEQLDRLFQLSDGAADVLRELATNYRLLASILLERNELQQACEAYKTSATHSASLVALQPDNALYHRDRAVSHLNAGNMLERLRDTTAARSQYRVGLESARRAAELDPQWSNLLQDATSRLEQLGHG